MAIAEPAPVGAAALGLKGAEGLAVPEGEAAPVPEGLTGAVPLEYWAEETAARVATTATRENCILMVVGCLWVEIEKSRWIEVFECSTTIDS